MVDNIDKGVKPRHQRIDAQTKTLHYVQVCGVKDWIDYSKLSSSPPSPGHSICSIIPTTSDYQILKDNFTIFVARFIVKYIPYYSEDLKGLATSHILHEYSCEMAMKAEVVCEIKTLMCLS